MLSRLVRHSLPELLQDRKSTRLNSSHLVSSYAVFCLKKNRRHACGRVRLTSALDTTSGSAFAFLRRVPGARLATLARTSLRPLVGLAFRHPSAARFRA